MKKIFNWFKKVENWIFILGYVIGLILILCLMVSNFKDDYTDFDSITKNYSFFAIASIVFICVCPLWFARLFKYIYLDFKTLIITKSCKLFKKHVSKKCDLTECNSQIHDHTKKCDTCYHWLAGA